MLNLALLASRLQSPLVRAAFQEWVFPDGTLATQFYHIDEGFLLRFPAIADFEIPMDGITVTCAPAPGVKNTTIEHLYLNQVLPLVLSKLGKPVFHASAVEVAGYAIAFVADSGRGKSTLAACFAVNGFRLLTDDGLVLEASNQGYDVLPSHPSIRLWEDSQEALITPGATAAPNLPFTSKTRFLAGGNIVFCQQLRPLRKVYFLGDGSARQIAFQRMTATDAFVEWTKHSFLLDAQAQPMLTSHFNHVTKLAKQPICYRLDFPRRFEDLPHVRHAIVAHASAKANAA